MADFNFDTNVVQPIEQIAAPVVSQVQDWGNQIGQGIGQAWNQVQGFGQQVGQDLGQGWNQGVQQVENFGSQVGQGLSNDWNQAQPIFQQPFQQLGQAFDQGIQSLSNLGSQAFQPSPIVQDQGFSLQAPQGGFATPWNPSGAVDNSWQQPFKATGEGLSNWWKGLSQPSEGLSGFKGGGIGLDAASMLAGPKESKVVQTKTYDSSTSYNPTELVSADRGRGVTSNPVATEANLREQGFRNIEGTWKQATTLRDFYDEKYFLDHGYLIRVNGQVVPNPDMLNTDRGRSFYNAGLLPAWGGMGPTYVLGAGSSLNNQGIDKNAFSDFAASLQNSGAVRNTDREVAQADQAWANRKAWIPGADMTLAQANPLAMSAANRPSGSIFNSIDPLTGKSQLSTSGQAFMQAGMSMLPNQITYGANGPMYRTAAEMNRLKAAGGDQAYLNPQISFPTSLPSFGPRGRTTTDENGNIIPLTTRDLHGTILSPTGVPGEFTTPSGGSLITPKSCIGGSCGLPSPITSLQNTSGLTIAEVPEKQRSSNVWLAFNSNPLVSKKSSSNIVSKQTSGENSSFGGSKGVYSV